MKERNRKAGNEKKERKRGNIYGRKEITRIQVRKRGSNEEKGGSRGKRKELKEGRKEIKKDKRGRKEESERRGGKSKNKNNERN